MTIVYTDSEFELLHIIGQCAHQLHTEAYAIGGFIRDKILNRPCKDIDIVCPHDGIALAELCANTIPHATKVTIFQNYGTAQIKVNDINIEFVGARKESYATNSRNPKVSAGSIQDDFDRRDFTINAIAITLDQQNFGEIIDPFEGLRDIITKRIVTPLDPDITFSDDPLRMMRAIRFASQLGFSIDKETFHSIKKNTDRITIISQERITDELNKIILSKQPSIGFKLLFDAGLLKIILPELANLFGIDKIEHFAHKDNFYHTLQVLDNIAIHSNDLWLRWAAILHDIAKPATKRFEPNIGWTFHGHEVLGAKMVKGIFKKLKLPLSEPLKFVEKLVLLHLRPIALTHEEIKDAAIRRVLFEAGNDIDALMLLCEADITSRNEEKVKRYLEKFEQVRSKFKEVEERDHLRNFQPPVNGEEIMSYYHLKPCPKVGEIKNAIKEAILDGIIPNDKSAAQHYMKELFPLKKIST